MGQGRHTPRSISDPVYPLYSREVDVKYSIVPNLIVHYLFHNVSFNIHNPVSQVTREKFRHISDLVTANLHDYSK